jgi:hypothetical protein
VTLALAVEKVRKPPTELVDDETLRLRVMEKLRVELSLGLCTARATASSVA